jgi:methyl-accepting chemotaxis protein
VRNRLLCRRANGANTSAESVSVASKQIASGNLDLSARTEEQAASLQQTAASMLELTQTVSQNSDNARNANNLALKAASVVDAGNTAVDGMVQTIDQISDSSTKISEITGVIEGIAFQTNASPARPVPSAKPDTIYRRQMR